MKKYIKPDAEIVKFDIVDITTAGESIYNPLNPFANNAVDEGVYVEADGYMTPVVD